MGTCHMSVTPHPLPSLDNSSQLLPSTQSKVSRIVGSGDPQAAVEVCEVHVKDLEKRSRQPSPSVGEGLPM